MLTTLDGIVMSVKLLQPQNASPPMEITPSGIVMLFKPLQPSNTRLSMEVTPLGILMLVKPLQPQSAPLPIKVTLSGIVIPAEMRSSFSSLLSSLSILQYIFCLSLHFHCLCLAPVSLYFRLAGFCVGTYPHIIFLSRFQLLDCGGDCLVLIHGHLDFVLFKFLVCSTLDQIAGDFLVPFPLHCGSFLLCGFHGGKCHFFRFHRQLDALLCLIVFLCLRRCDGNVSDPTSPNGNLTFRIHCGNLFV